MSLSFDTTCTDGSSLLTYDCHRTVPAPFLTKTYHLVDDPATDDIVSWGEDETTFVVWRPPEFARDLLPNYFKHNNFSSFVRQLNTYGFRKIVPDRWEFANEFFRRGEKQLLCEIHRRKSSQPGASDAPCSQSISPTNSCEDQAWSPFTSPLSSPRTTILPQCTSALMTDENERLRRDNRMLLLELSHLRQLYDEIVVVLQQQSKVSLQDLDPLSRLRGPKGLTDKKINDPISEQLEAAARRSQMVLTRKDAASSGPLRPPSVESASIGLLNRHQQSAAHRPDSATPKASTLSFLDGKLREMASNTQKASAAGEATRNAPRLFGVALHARVNDHGSSQGTGNSCPDVGQKRPRASSWGPDESHFQPQGRPLACTDQETTESGNGVVDVCTHDLNLQQPKHVKHSNPLLQRVGPAASSFKCVKTELERSSELLRPSRDVEAPWLRISATRDERVLI